MRQAMMDGRQRPGVTENDFVDTARRRIAAIGRLDIGIEENANTGQSARELAHDRDRLALDGRQIDRRVVTGNVSQFQTDLVKQAAQGAVERMANVEILTGALLQVGWTEAHGEECAAQSLDDVAQGVTGRKLAAARFQGAVLRPAPMLARSAQVADDGVETPEIGG
jgi:hypothetical protein